MRYICRCWLCYWHYVPDNWEKPNVGSSWRPSRYSPVCLLNTTLHLWETVVAAVNKLNGVLITRSQFSRREETGVPRGNPWSQVEIDWNSCEPSWSWSQRDSMVFSNRPAHPCLPVPAHFVWCNIPWSCIKSHRRRGFLQFRHISKPLSFRLGMSSC